MLDDVVTEAIKWGTPVVLAALSGWAMKRRAAIRGWCGARRDRGRAFDQLLKDFPAAIDKIGAIEYQVKPNGGGSLFDQVTRTASTVDAQSGDIATLKSTAASIEVMVRSQADLATEGMFECDGTGSNVWVNLTYARLLGVGRMDLLGQRWKNHVHPEDLPVYVRQAESALREHRMLSARVRMVRSDGDVITCDVTVLPHPDAPPAHRWFGKLRLVA